MSFFERIFGNSGSKTPQPDIRFGRYSDSYKESDNYEAWDQALEKFETEDYIESYRAFFRYLRDEQEDNVKWWEDGDGIGFELYQGSKKISGFADAKILKAEAKIAHSDELNVNFMRHLIERNFDLNYSRFALDDDNNLTIVFDTYTIDGSPYKLYYALKEVATNADKQDDLLLDEFKVLQPIESAHLEELPDFEKEAKYNFIRAQIESVLKEIDEGKLNRDQYPGGIAYLLLDLTYKLDYLTKPEGYTMETLERIHRLYFAKDEKTTSQKNVLLCKELRKLMDRPKEDFFKEMYRVTTTFGITTPVNHDRVVSVIDGELHNMDWYKDNNHLGVAVAVPGYIVGFCLFNYAIPKPDRDLLHLYFQIIESDYFKTLGFQNDFYDSQNNNFNRRAIRKAIDSIVDAHRSKYNKLNPITSILRYDSLVEFAKSYLLMIRNLDVTKTD
ncbi:MAG: hypothetical protein SFU99_09380 [Saprospiraceae bacterium]|nr:hypothetical protein [Saprospiraceae bacterium]